MVKIMSQKTLGKYAVLEIDRELPKTSYRKYKIEGKEYDIISVSSMKKTIVIETNESLIGKIVEFI